MEIWSELQHDVIGYRLHRKLVFGVSAVIMTSFANLVIGGACSLSVSTDVDAVAVGYDRGRVVVWSNVFGEKTRTEVRRGRQKIQAHVAFLSENRLTIVDEGGIVLEILEWRENKSLHRRKVKGPIDFLAVDESVIYATGAGWLSTYSTEDLRLLQRMRVFKRKQNTLVNLGDKLAILSGDVEGVVLANTIASPMSVNVLHRTTDQLFRSPVLSNDLARAAVVIEGESIRVWDMKKRTKFDIVGDEVHLLAHSLAFSTDGRKLIVGLVNGSLRIVDVESQAQTNFELVVPSPAKSAEIIALHSSRHGNKEVIVALTEDEGVWVITGLDTGLKKMRLDQE